MEKLNEYNAIKDAICNSISHKVVESNDESISLFETIKLINAYINPLIEIKNNNDLYVDYMKHMIDVELKNKKYSTSFVKYIKKFSIDKVDLMPGIQGFFTKVFLHRKRGIKTPHYYETNVGKNIDGEMEVQSIIPYYTSNENEIKFCISQCEDYLGKLIDFANEYVPFLNQVGKISNIKTDLYDISLSYTTRGVIAKIRPNEKTIDLQAFYGNYGKVQPLEQLVEENKDLILWCTSIPKELLPDELKSNLEKKKTK